VIRSFQQREINTMGKNSGNFHEASSTLSQR